ncbi:MAG: mismatch-specific DNA-glycosylase [Microthrixaceae bacterium]|nr:mismatch-specific DNA-glycosylase [Microthrixaceae bacterium]
MALHALHRSLSPGEEVHLDFAAVDAEVDQDTAAGPRGTPPRWPTELLVSVFEGAGFAPVHTEAPLAGGTGAGPRDRCELHVRAVRADTLADTVGPGMRMLLVGLNPSPAAARSGIPFSGPSNRGWPALAGSGLATAGQDPEALLSQSRVGMTDLVKRTTARAAEIDRDEFRAGLARLERLCSWLTPAVVCVVGLSGWRVAADRGAGPGLQDATLGGSPVWLMPNPSGLNTHVGLPELVAHLRGAAELADAQLR